MRRPIISFYLLLFIVAAPIASADNDVADDDDDNVAAYYVAPGNLRITLNTPYSALLEWDEAQQQADGAKYLLFRNGASLGVRKGTSFLDNALLPEREFTYSLATVSPSGGCFNNREITFITLAKDSNEAAAAKASTGPASPANLIISRDSSDTLILSWDNAEGNDLSFTVSRNGELLETVSNNVFVDTIAGASKQLQYQVVAIDTDDRRSPEATINLDNSKTLTHCSFEADIEDSRIDAKLNAATDIGVDSFSTILKTGPAYTIPLKPANKPLPIRGDGLDVFLVNGQSNANPQFLAALTQHLTRRGYDFLTAHYYVGGQPLSTWIGEDGTLALRWPIMMNIFDGITSMCVDSSESVRSITLVHYQGEADVNTTETLIAVQDNVESPFKRRLTAFVNEFSRHFEERCGITPNIALAIISFNEDHPLFPARLSAAHLKIRNDIAEVAREHGNVGAFDTIDLEHADHVHLALYPGRSAQLIATERALDLFFRGFAAPKLKLK